MTKTPKLSVPCLCISLFLMFFCPPASMAKSKEKLPFAAGSALMKAQILMQKKDVAGAAKVLETFRSRAPKELKPGDPDPKGYQHYQVNFALGNCYLELKKINKAVLCYEAALKTKPDFSYVWLNLAKCYYDTKRYKKAGTGFLKGYEFSEKKNPSFLYFSAVSFMAGGDNKKSIKILERLVSLHNEQIKLEWKELIARVYLACNQPVKALPWIEKICKEAKENKKKQWQEMLLRQYLVLNMKKKALMFADKLTREDPLEPKWWKGLVNIYLSENRYKEALTPLTIYTCITSPSRDEQKLLADINMAVGIPSRAAPIYENILNSNAKKDADLIDRLIQAYINCHNSQMAIKTINRAIINYPGTRTYKRLILKGQLLMEEEKYKDAFKAFEMAAKAGGNRGKSYMMAAYAALNLEDYQKAKKALQKAKKYPGQRRKAKELLTNLQAVSINK